MYAVWDGKTGAFITTGTPYWNTFRGGVRVGAADMDGDGKAEILACLGPGGYATGAYIYKGREQLSLHGVQHAGRRISGRPDERGRSHRLSPHTPRR